MQLQWQKCVGDVWGELLYVDLSHPHFNNMEGVYIIWQNGGPIVRIGQGNFLKISLRHLITPVWKPRGPH